MNSFIVLWRKSDDWLLSSKPLVSIDHNDLRCSELESSEILQE